MARGKRGAEAKADRATKASPRSSKGKNSSSEEAARRNALPPSVADGNPDKQREESRVAASQSKYPTPASQKQAEERAKQQEKSSRQQSSSKKPRTLDDEQGEIPQPALAGQVDHAIANHPRSEHDHSPAHSRATIEGPAPKRIDEEEDDNLILEQLRLETKADNLYLLRRQERERDDSGRKHVIDAINTRLREVQGDPILPE